LYNSFTLMLIMRASQAATLVGNQEDIFKLSVPWRGDAGALINFFGIEQVKDGEPLDLKDFVHAIEAETALAVEEIGDMGLPEAGLLGEADTGELSVLDLPTKTLAKVFLQALKLHAAGV
jgi:hypothetical protein